MGDISSTCTIAKHVPVIGYTEIIVETPNTADTGDTIALTLANYNGATTLLSVQGFVHTTENSVIVAEAPTCAVSNGVATLTIGGSTVSDKKRVYKVLVK